MLLLLLHKNNLKGKDKAESCKCNYYIVSQFLTCNHLLAVCCSGVTCMTVQGYPGESKDSSPSRVQWGRVSEAHDRFVQMSRMAFGETPNLAESSAAECFVLVLP